MLRKMCVAKVEWRREREREEFAVHVTGASANVISNKQGAPLATKYVHAC